MTTLTRRGRMHLLRGSVLMFLALWITGGGEPVRAMTSCDYDTTCEPSLGENCEFCSDCSCSCGDNYCSPGEPYQENCFTCPEDCEEMCICGDGYCVWPAEGGFYTWPTCAMSGNPECTTCGVDCWDCQYWYDCNSNVCQDGACVQCQSYNDCWDFGVSFCAPNDWACEVGECICVL